jgi:hypothetical protein
MQDRSNRTQHRAQGTLAGHRILLFGLHLAVTVASSRTAVYLGQTLSAKETEDRTYDVVAVPVRSAYSLGVVADQLASGLEDGVALDPVPQNAPSPAGSFLLAYPGSLCFVVA